MAITPFMRVIHPVKGATRMTQFSRAEVEQAFQHHDALTRRFAYHEAAQLYLEDGWAGNTVFGVFHGRAGIEEFFRHNPSDLGYDVDWVVIEGARVVNRWRHWLPGRRSDGTRYDFVGIAERIYAGDGQWKSLYSIPDVVNLGRRLAEWEKDTGRKYLFDPTARDHQAAHGAHSSSSTDLTPTGRQSGGPQ